MTTPQNAYLQQPAAQDPTHGAHGQPGGAYAATATGTEQRRPDVDNVSVGELFGQIAQDLSTLIRQELELAKAELRQEASKAGKAAGALGGAGLAGYMVALFLSLALWGGLSNVMDWGWAGLIVAVLWGVIGAVLFAFGRSKLREVRPVPQQTVDTLKEVPDAVRGR